MHLYSFPPPYPSAISTLSLHDALPIFQAGAGAPDRLRQGLDGLVLADDALVQLVIGQDEAIKADRKSTRLNSSHVSISYAVFCLKKKKQYDIVVMVTYSIKMINRIERD